VRLAEECYHIGPSESRQSYLAIDKILDAAKRAGADAVHPGYGFLAENARFAQACADAGLTFIGPSAHSIALMGSKLESRKAVAQFKVPIIPGTMEPVSSLEEAQEAARAVGYPVMLKASAGGGGKGLRLVHRDSELAAAFRDTKSESAAAFGDDAVYLEKYAERPRHVEIQVLADRHGNAVHLGERECTLQRRHQKVIEECPSPIMDAELRARMGAAALEVVRAAGYYNAGTVEFLVDANRKFYFLEMNTRLQVEHPVTELVTGRDLVIEQIRIAAGEELGFRQEDVVLRGAAIECRVYAEDPDMNFLPSPGKIQMLQTPAGPGVRNDSGVYAGWTVPVDYDPLISKLATWGPTRASAIGRMQRALHEYRVEGIRTNLEFFRRLLEETAVRSADFDTSFIETWMATRKPMSHPLDPDSAVLAAVAAVLAEQDRPVKASEPAGSPASSNWKAAGRQQGMRS
jgi:acetyl-CoA carboxylase biotin carboxylase subunit